MNRLIAKYRIKLAAKRVGAGILSAVATPAPASSPPVTLLVVSYNTRYATELALRSLQRHTRYPNYEIWVVENGSTDGSLEALRPLRDELGFRLIESPDPKLHAHWLDYAMTHVGTPYWFAVDSDLLFLGRDWLADMVATFEADPHLYLVGGEAVPGGVGVEPVGGKTVESGEHVSTWLFGVRASLRERVTSSFAFHKAGVNPETGLERVYDSGGKILADMRDRGLRYGYMPRPFRLKYHHYGSLSWAFSYDVPAPYRELKTRQLRDIERRVRALRRSGSATVAV